MMHADGVDDDTEGAAGWVGDGDNRRIARNRDDSSQPNDLEHQK